MKQKATERTRGIKMMEKMESVKAAEREKIKNGKKPFFLKGSMKKHILLEEK